MGKIEQLNEELDDLMVKVEDILGKEEARKVFEEHNIPDTEEVIARQDVNERG